MGEKTPEWLKHGEGFNDITLSRPLDIGGALTTAVRMREPTVADQEAADHSGKTDAARELILMGNLCELAPDSIRRLPLRDYKRLQTAFLGFID